MTPKEKAKELVEKFLLPVTTRWSDPGVDTSKREISTAKSCAAAHCEEMIQYLSGWPIPRDTTIQNGIKFYTKVLAHVQ